MMTLFNDIPVLPPGFRYVDGFIDASEELALMKAIDEITLHPFVFQGYEAKRRVASFGYDYSFDDKSMKPGQRIPEIFQPLIEKVAAFLEIPVARFEEVLITEYPKGSVINWHRDAPPFELIAGISLAADCVLKLRPIDESARGAVRAVPLNRRSLYIISGESRTAWQHSIAPVNKRRYSITLRTLRKKY